MRHSLPRLLRAVAGLLFALLAASAEAQADQRSLVTAATVTFAEFRNDPGMTWLQRNLPRAKAVMIAPALTKAGLIVGGSGGRAVVVARDPKSGKWVGPAFYTLASGSVGFQAGVAVTEMVTLVMSDRGLNSLLSDSFKMGGDATVAAGPARRRRSIRPRRRSDFLQPRHRRLRRRQFRRHRGRAIRPVERPLLWQAGPRHRHPGAHERAQQPGQ